MDRRSPFDQLRQALAGHAEPETDGVRVDSLRTERCGIPEIVYCHGKSMEAIVSACVRLAAHGQSVLATRCDPDAVPTILETLQAKGISAVFEHPARTLIIAGPDAAQPEFSGTIGLLTAGSSDWGVASVAKLVAEHAGCAVLSFQDCGVAGLHRLVGPLESLIEADVAAIIVAAGMDGVLPSVVAGLVDVPVIGLPTSTGYGHGGLGEGALTTMLQACAPGVAVVNIDNGVGAGAMAALIAKRVNRGRQSAGA